MVFIGCYSRRRAGSETALTTNDLFILCLVLICSMSVFVGAILPDAGFFNTLGDLSLPAGWDFFFDTIDAYVNILTFSIEGLPVFLVFFTWGLTLITIWCLMRMIFGG